MFGHIAWFELRYQLKSPVLWITFILFFLLTFIATTNDKVQIGSAGNAFINGPYAITQTIGIMAIFAQFAVVAFVANVVLRDWETGFGPILHATRIRKFGYLFGRFVGAVLASAVVLAAAPLAMMLGSFMPWLDHEKLGPFVPWFYLYAFLTAGLPTLILCSAMFFALATATRSMMASYIGLISFLVLYLVISGLFARPEYEQAVALFEPYGLGALFETTKYWTASDRNTQLMPITALYLENRAIWGGVAAFALFVAYFMFSFSTKAARKEQKARKLSKAAGENASMSPATITGAAKRAFGGSAAWTQVLARARFEAGYVFSSPAFIVLLAIGLFNGGGAMWFSTESIDGTELYPTTLLMVQALAGGFTAFPVIIATYYAGELVWRDREKRMHELIDSTPAPDWTFATPKILALTTVLAATVLIGVLAGVIIQTIKGGVTPHLDEYLVWYALPAMISCFCLASLAVFFQAASPHKFVGWGLMLLYLISTLVLSQMGFDHRLYLYAATPGVPLSEMNDHSHYWIGRAWFQAYWVSFALLLSVLAYSLWRRGADVRLLPRLSALPRKLAGPAGALAGALLIVFIGLGGWIFYNTNVLNPYRSNLANERWTADEERALLHYETAPQPKITDVTFRVDLYPHQHRATAQGAYVIVNREAAPLTEIHLLWPRDLKIDHVAIDGATLADDFAKHTPSFPFQIWRLTTPMQPGERREIHFTTTDAAVGFRNSNVLDDVNNNGTFINDRSIAPTLGFTRDVLLRDRTLRRRYGLPAELRMPRLEDDSARRFNYLRHDSDWVNADITLSTEQDQTPIAPGYLVSDQTANGRRTAHFRTDAPIMNFFSMQSAHYAVRRGRWRDVDLAVYYDPRHAYNVDRIIRAMQASFDVYTKDFSPFQFRQMRVLEFPAYATFAQSFANTVPYSEGIGFTTRINDARNAREADRIDFVTYVTAHEVGHQWWAHQIIGANMQGSTMLSETFAQYSALLVMERLYGRDQVRRFLRYELDNYLRSRGGEAVEEEPLARVENQGYIHYRKGGVTMYFLASEVGEDTVNRALRRLLQEFAFHGAPYPRSSDFLRILREEVGPDPRKQALITDLFERITLYDARVVGATTTQRPDGRWDLNLTVEAHKRYANGQGRETEAPLDEDFEIGVFTAEPGRGVFSARDVLTMTRRPIHSGQQTLALTVDSQPRFAGIDPYNKRIDRNSDDNVGAVTVAATPARARS